MATKGLPRLSRPSGGGRQSKPLTPCDKQHAAHPLQHLLQGALAPRAHPPRRLPVGNAALDATALLHNSCHTHHNASEQSQGRVRHTMSRPAAPGVLNMEHTHLGANLALKLSQDKNLYTQVLRSTRDSKCRETCALRVRKSGKRPKRFRKHNCPDSRPPVTRGCAERRDFSQRGRRNT